MKIKKVVVGPLNNNTYLAVSEKGNAVLIDPGMNYARIMEMIEKELLNVPNLKVREIAEKYIHDIEGGKRDFRF